MESSGYTLFMDISDPTLRAHNRAATLFSILGMHTKKKKTNLVGVREMVEYMQCTPQQDRKAVIDKLTSLMGES